VVKPSALLINSCLKAGPFKYKVEVWAEAGIKKKRSGFHAQLGAAILTVLNREGEKTANI